MLSTCTHRMLAALAVVFAWLASSHSSVNAQEISAGERLFRQRCAACHAVQSGRNIVGPHLAGIAGRKAGSVEGVRYSQGMRELGLSWDAAQLEKYLANPGAMVPGTTMAVSVPNAGERASLVAYLESLAAAR